MPSILDMPDVAMNLILKKSDFKSIQNLRKSCRDFRNFIDDAKPESNVTKFSISPREDVINFGIRFKTGGAIVDYHKKDGLISYSSSSGLKKKKYFQNSNFLDIAIRDLESILNSKNSGIFNNFEIDLKLKDETTERFSDKFLQVLKCRPLIKAKSLKMIVNCPAQVLTFLSFFDPRNLKKFELKVDVGLTLVEFDLSEIVKLEQWKNLKEFESDNFAVNIPTANLIHFERISIHVNKTPLAMVLELKEAFLSNRHLASFEIYHLFFKVDVIKSLEEMFGVPFETDNEFLGQYFFRTPGDSEKVHGISYNQMYFLFNRIRREEVPQGAVIL